MCRTFEEKKEKASSFVLGLLTVRMTCLYIFPRLRKPGDEADTAGGGKGGDKGTECLASTLHPASDMDNYTSFFLHVNVHIWWGSGVGCMGAGMISQLC